MRLPRLNRRQKLARNTALILLALCLISWENQFPSLTKSGLLRRAERQYLLETPSQVLRTEWDLDGGTILAKNGTYLLSLGYDRTLVGYRGSASLHEEEILVSSDFERGGRGEWDYFYPSYQAVGLLEDAATAEVERAVGGDVNGSWVIPGEKTDDYCFRFCYVRQYAEEDTSPEAELERTMLRGEYSSSEETVTFRFYDENGALLAEIVKDGYF